MPYGKFAKRSWRPVAVTTVGNQGGHMFDKQTRPLRPELYDADIFAIGLAPIHSFADGDHPPASDFDLHLFLAEFAGQLLLITNQQRIFVARRDQIEEQLRVKEHI